MARPADDVMYEIIKDDGAVVYENGDLETAKKEFADRLREGDFEELRLLRVTTRVIEHRQKGIVIIKTSKTRAKSKKKLEKVAAAGK